MTGRSSTDVRTSRRGIFIAVEGLDGAGTTSQCRLLTEWLTEIGYHVELTHEPSNGPLGQVLRSALERRTELEPSTMALAFAADRHDHLFNAVNGIHSMLSEGTWVVCDRYVLSSLAYQASQGEEVDWLVALNAKALTPDITIFVDTPPDACVRRILRRSLKDEYFHRQHVLEEVQRAYREVLRRGVFVSGLVTADGTAPIEIVHKQVRDGVLPWLDVERADRPVREIGLARQDVR